MAKLKTPLFSIAAAGQIGGLLYRSGTYGPIVSRRSITPALHTQTQLAQRGRLKRAHTAWMALTDADRAAWDAYATYPETGRNAYIRAFTILDKIGHTPATAPNPNLPSGQLLNIQLIWDIPPPFRALALWTHTGDHSLAVIASVYQTWSNRATPKPSKLRFINHVHLNANYTAIPLGYQAPNNWIRFDVRDISTAALVGSYLTNLEYP